MVWVALAGPVTNLLLALGCVLVLKTGLPLIGAGTGPSSFSGLVGFFAPIARMAEYGILINIVLAVFNLLPLPPLDGGRVAVGLLPEPSSSILARVEPYGFLILIVLLMTHALDNIIGAPVEFLINFYFRLI
jgi:Zn-dependent protease